MTQPELPLDTRAEARERSVRRAEMLRLKSFYFIQRCGQRGATADEVATELNESVLSIRPRVTELFKRSKIIYDSGRRRPNASGYSARVLVAAGFKNGPGQDRRRGSQPTRVADSPPQNEGS